LVRHRPRLGHRASERGGIRLVSQVTGELREAKVVTAVDDHSRYCVIARVAERATSRVVCLALAEALARFGVPEEIISDIQAG
jgi:transposase InsO family protein